MIAQVVYIIWNDSRLQVIGSMICLNKMSEFDVSVFEPRPKMHRCLPGEIHQIL